MSIATHRKRFFTSHDRWCFLLIHRARCSSIRLSSLCFLCGWHNKVTNPSFCLLSHFMNKNNFLTVVSSEWCILLSLWTHVNIGLYLSLCCVRQWPVKTKTRDWRENGGRWRMAVVGQFAWRSCHQETLLVYSYSYRPQAFCMWRICAEW